ncbi:MAG: hypothetical protein PVF63_06775 [Gammaproteobacteria bacterium]|jgi:hypothetical protein
MKWIIAFLLGILAGVAAAAVLLYVNPLSGQKLASVEGTTLLSYEFGPRTLSFTHGDQLGFDLQPRDVPTLWESTISRTMLGMFVLSDLQGSPVAVASRALKLSNDSNALTRGIVVADHWLVTVPGAGTYFIDSEENFWPVIRDTFVDVNLLGRDWEGARLYELSIGPDNRGAASLVGVSGRFAGVRGAAVHSIELRDYERTSQLLYPVAGQLRLDARRAEQQAATTP